MRSAFGWASKVQKLQRFVRPFGWASEVYKNQVSFGRSGGLPKYGKPSFKPQRFVRPFGWAFEVWKNQVLIGCSEERENSKIRSGMLPCSEELENSKIRSGRLPCSEEWENSKDSIWWASEERKTKKPRFVRSGGLPKNENPKIRSGGLPMNENPKIKIHKDSFGWIPTFQGTEKTKDLIQWAFKEQRKTKIRLVSRMGSDKQKKTKDS
ncbi:hypothetical protein GLOIN_2v1779851 [Rhizophagus irregularis DAOM 181602=DAOM 197198]|nr:hypothetical protein GLOIN_2v1779851 [Rhizophagus irregularis DAOM 181602=DAOM 197198]